jgi:deazaflavin-dependent oxidoreductase (nitroreductase family)
MAVRSGTFDQQISRVNEITITVTGRKSGRKISLPIWFVWENGTLYLLPVKGSDTQWYKNALENPSMKIDAGGAHTDVKVKTVTDAGEVKSVVEKFRSKYGPGDVKKYYSKFDVAVTATAH